MNEEKRLKRKNEMAAAATEGDSFKQFQVQALTIRNFWNLI